MEDEVELTLGLSIGGGGFKKFERSVEAKSDLTSVSNFELDLEEQQRNDKREIHAMRRQEARKKREEKKRVRAIESEEEETKKKNRKKKKESEEALRIQQTEISNLYFPPVQYVPFGNGLPFPYQMVPCWAPAPASADEKNLFHPIAFRPFPAFPVKARDKSGEESGAAVSCCSSAVSESPNGTSSREASHSVESKSEQQQQVHASIKSNAEGQTEHSDSSHPKEPSQGLEEQGNTCTDKIVSSDNTNHSTERKTQEQDDISTTNPSPKHPLRKTSGDTNKPPKPQPKSPSSPLSRSQSLPQIPCVSTTGDGPNGKTINGFLYKYNKTEVSIMCVCHRSSFTPAEFVKHAGGTDVSHPLRQIVVVPSAFGLKCL